MNKVVNSQSKEPVALYEEPVDPWGFWGFISLTAIVIGLTVCVILSYNNKSEEPGIPTKEYRVSKGKVYDKNDPKYHSPYYQRLRNVYNKDNEVSKGHEGSDFPSQNFILGLAFLLPSFIVWVFFFRNINWSHVKKVWYSK